MSSREAPHFFLLQNYVTIKCWRRKCSHVTSLRKEDVGVSQFMYVEKYSLFALVAKRILTAVGKWI